MLEPIVEQLTRRDGIEAILRQLLQEAASARWASSWAQDDLNVEDL